MASPETVFTSTCLLCYETRPLKIVGKCKHSFCTKCLSATFDSLETASVVFACPSCKEEYPRPHDGLQGLVDFTGVTDGVTDADTQPEAAKETETSAKDTIDVICDLCRHRQREVSAANVCSECNHLHICQDCSEMHGRNKATRHHILTPIVSKRKVEEKTCESHNELLISLCKTCDKPVCRICVSLDHGDHNVKRLADVIRTKVKAVKATLWGIKGKTMKELQQLKTDLALLKSIAPEVDKQDTLIKEVEDHAQRLIDKIVKCKEDLKREIKGDFKVIRDISDALEKVTETVQNLQQTADRATQVLAESEHHPMYLDQLVASHQDLLRGTETGDYTEERKLQNQLFELNRNVRSFSPGSEPSFGKIDTALKGVKCFTNDTTVFKHTMEADSDDMFVPCVADLSPKYFAVAHPVKPSELSVAVDIYEYPGTLQRTFRDHVPPIYDMTATNPRGLALLSDGTRGGCCSVKLFDPETGYVSCTRDIEMAKPLSLGVTVWHQYAILGVNDQGRSQITVVDEDGTVDHQYVIDEANDKISKPEKITCGWRFMFANGGNFIAIYEVKDTVTRRITHVSTIKHYNVKGISATTWDGIFIAEANYDKSVCLSFHEDKGNHLKWPSRSYKHDIFDKPAGGGDMPFRVSTRNGKLVVVSHAITIKVIEFS